MVLPVEKVNALSEFCVKVNGTMVTLEEQASCVTDRFIIKLNKKGKFEFYLKEDVLDLALKPHTIVSDYMLFSKLVDNVLVRYYKIEPQFVQAEVREFIKKHETDIDKIGVMLQFL